MFVVLCTGTDCKYVCCRPQGLQEEVDKIDVNKAKIGKREGKLLELQVNNMTAHVRTYVFTYVCTR